MPDGKSLPIIVWNGNIVPNATSLQKMFEDSMPRTRYEVQNYDCHVINPNYIAEGIQLGDAATRKNMTLLVTVSGFVKYGTERSAPAQGFSENLVLVPNSDAANTTKNARVWVIQSQTFRLVT